MVLDAPSSSLQVSATVDEVLPMLGLAYVSDAEGHIWGLTRHADGVGLEQLSPGQRLQVTLTQHADFTLASAYAPFDELGG